MFNKSSPGAYTVNYTDKQSRHLRAFVVLLIVAIGLIVYLCTLNSVVGFVLAGLLLFFLIKRLFFSRLVLKEGDVVSISGLPGAGKSVFLSKIVRDNLNNDSFEKLCANSHFEHNKFVQYKYNKKDMQSFDLNKGVWFADEMSLTGFDCRDSRNAFTPEALEFFKLIRHHHSAIVYTNQGGDETDKKIRKYLCNKFYFCKNKGFYSVAYKLVPEECVDEHGMPDYCYRYPTLLERIIDPTCQMYFTHKKYGKDFDTYFVPHPKPDIITKENSAIVR